MSAEPIEIDDVEDALRRADEYAELTGRDKVDIIADLLDDGQLNRSAGADIEPTKDLLDIAQEKAEKLKGLLITIAPMIALLMGVGAEGLGVLDFTDWGEDSMWEDDPNHPPPVMWGCMDGGADNFDPHATQDDGSCDYPPDPPKIWGCTDPAAENYEPEANEDDESCDYPPEPIEGCTDDSADNYNEEAEQDDGSCEYPPEPIEGCTDPEAENYNEDADEDDGSCTYPPECTVGFYAYQLSYGDSNNTTLEVYSDPDELTCGETVTVDIYFELTWAGNGTIAWSTQQQANITGESWEDVRFNSPTLANGTYTGTLELYIMVDGERETTTSEVRTWNDVKIGDGEADHP